MYNAPVRKIDRMREFEHLLKLSHPLFLHYKFLITDIEDELSKAQGILVDFGCGNKPYQKLCPNVTEYIGVDIDKANKLADVYADASETGIAGNYADVTVAFQLLEHTPNPQNVLNEMYRVLKKGGRLFMTLPMSWELHEEPYDFFRFTKHGITHLLKEAGFSEIRVKNQGTDISALAIGLNKIVYNKPIGGKFAVKLINFFAQKKEKNTGTDVLNYAVYAKK